MSGMPSGAVAAATAAAGNSGRKPRVFVAEVGTAAAASTCETCPPFFRLSRISLFSRQTWRLQLPHGVAIGRLKNQHGLSWCFMQKWTD